VDIVARTYRLGCSAQARRSNVYTDTHTGVCCCASQCLCINVRGLPLIELETLLERKSTCLCVKRCGSTCSSNESRLKKKKIVPRCLTLGDNRSSCTGISEETANAHTQVNAERLFLYNLKIENDFSWKETQLPDITTSPAYLHVAEVQKKCIHVTRVCAACDRTLCGTSHNNIRSQDGACRGPKSPTASSRHYYIYYKTLRTHGSSSWAARARESFGPRTPYYLSLISSSSSEMMLHKLLREAHTQRPPSRRIYIRVIESIYKRDRIGWKSDELNEPRAAACTHTSFVRPVQLLRWTRGDTLRRTRRSDNFRPFKHLCINFLSKRTSRHYEKKKKKKRRAACRYYYRIYARQRIPRYVYCNVCVYIHEKLPKRQKCTPVRVNITVTSRTYHVCVCCVYINRGDTRDARSRTRALPSINPTAIAFLALPPRGSIGYGGSVNFENIDETATSAMRRRRRCSRCCRQHHRRHDHRRCRDDDDDGRQRHRLLPPYHRISDLSSSLSHCHHHYPRSPRYC
ncbi:unnamed protein product, partial [Trichogramma brassicae]